MANEIAVTYPGSANLYVILRDLSNGHVWDGTAFAAWADGSIDDYDITLSSAGGDLYLADMPTGVDSGTRLRIVAYKRAGASPAITDLILTSYEKTWTGFALSSGSDSGAYPVTLEETKIHLRIDVSTEDDLITALIAAATLESEHFLGRTLITQTRYQYFSAWPNSNRLELRFPPLQSVTSIEYRDFEETDYTFSSTKYLVDTSSIVGAVVLKDSESWPGEALSPMAPIKVTYVAGYGDNPSDVPRNIRQGILIRVADLYEQRQDFASAAGVNLMTSNLKAAHRLWWPDRIDPC